MNVQAVRQENWNKREELRHKRELARIHQIKTSKPSVPLATVRGFVFKTRDDVFKRNDQLLSNRQLIHESMALKHSIAKLESEETLSLAALHALRHENLKTRIRIFSVI